MALVPILLWCLAGCIGADTVDSASFMKQFRDRSVSPDHAVITVARITRPLGDGYINGRLWENTSELFMDLERHAALKENGFRVGQLIGSPPSDFQELLLDERCCKGRDHLFPTSKSIALFLNESPLPQSAYDIVQGGESGTIELNGVCYCLDVNAEFANDGRTKLKLTPKVEHSEARLPFRAAPERQQWEMKLDKAAKRYPELSWEVTLGQNQYLLIGARAECLHTLGFNFFTQPHGAGVQQLLVIRNCRSSLAQETHQNSVEELVRADKTPPLALQASMPGSRGKGP
jgi:hypothetical protein